MSKRSIDPLDPVYELKYGSGENYIHGKIDGSKPVTFPLFVSADPLNLKITDIGGTQIGSKNKFNRFTSMNHNLILSDIEGTRSGSLKKGIISIRSTNPLDPIYSFPGDIELNKNKNPYGNTLHRKPKPKTEVNTPNGENNEEKIRRSSKNNPINGKSEYLFFLKYIGRVRNI